MSNAASDTLTTDLRAARAPGREVTIVRLRRDAPAYTWRAERTGFGGYQYRGTADGRTVLVYARATMCDHGGDDDFATLWYADEGTGPQSYGMWSLRREAEQGASGGGL